MVALAHVPAAAASLPAAHRGREGGVRLLWPTDELVGSSIVTQPKSPHEVVVTSQQWYSGWRANMIQSPIEVHRRLESIEEFEDTAEAIWDIMRKRAWLLGCNTVMCGELWVDLGPPMMLSAVGTPHDLERIV